MPEAEWADRVNRLDSDDLLDHVDEWVARHGSVPWSVM